MFLEVVSAWPHLSAKRRMLTNIVMSPPGLVPTGLAQPCLVCTVVRKAPAPQKSEAASEPFVAPLASQAQGSNRSISQETRIDITARFLAEADSGVDLSRTAMMRRMQTLEIVGDVDSYRHLLDCLVCGLETRMERLSVSFVLDLLASYGPRTFALHDYTVARDAFAEAVLDVVRLARLAEHASSALCWCEVLVEHPMYESLMDLGFTSALRLCLRASEAVELEAVMKELVDNTSDHLRPRVDDLRVRLLQATGQHGAVPGLEDTSVFVTHRNTMERERHVALHVEAIANIAGSPLPMVSETQESTRSPMSLEERLLESWGVTETRGPVLLWQGDERLARLHLASLVQAATAAERAPAASPLGLGLLGPVQSVDRLREDMNLVYEDLALPSVTQSWGQIGDDYAFASAGVGVRCTPLRNIWAAVGGEHGVGGKTDALLVYPREGAMQWPSLLEAADGVLFVVDAEELYREGSPTRKAIRALIGMWESHLESRDEGPPLQCTILLTGFDHLTDPAHEGLCLALDEAFERISKARHQALDEQVLLDMQKLGELAMAAIDDGVLEASLQARHVQLTCFALPSPSLHVHLHDIPLVWMLRTCGVRLNLERVVRRSAWPGI